jgi:hypothetical protein
MYGSSFPNCLQKLVPVRSGPEQAEKVIVQAMATATTDLIRVHIFVILSDL